MADKKLRVAFIGAGGIAGTHMRYLTAMDDVELVGASDINEESLARVEKDFNVPRTFTDWNEMLAAVEPDAVSVCTPNGLHATPTIDALNAGCHVLVEKPLAANVAEGEQMLEAARRNKRELVIGFQWRYHGAIQMFRRAADAGLIGKIFYMRCEAVRRRGIPNWGMFGRKDIQGGGPLIDIGVHMMEMSHYVMGSPKPVSASGSIFTNIGDRPCEVECMWPNWDHKTYTVEDVAIGHIRFENGAVMQIESTFAAHAKDSWNFHFMGEKAGGSFDPPLLFKDEAGTMFDQAPGYLPQVDAFQVKMRKFVDTALYGKPSDSPAEHGLILQKMMEAIYVSAEKGCEVAID